MVPMDTWTTNKCNSNPLTIPFINMNFIGRHLSKESSGMNMMEISWIQGCGSQIQKASRFRLIDLKKQNSFIVVIINKLNLEKKLI